MHVPGQSGLSSGFSVVVVVVVVVGAVVGRGCLKGAGFLWGDPPPPPKIDPRPRAGATKGRMEVAMDAASDWGGLPPPPWAGFLWGP